ncbi:hypothetical protein AVEN_145050-1 [Araneus ventricosus]|uniref:Uncharacterized protein n=1 Tax=Araneus ventricosus TaxID=182803 RepID=A0A4Y2SFG6_ARAVE|nr:hypothetical protein AVEN_145050-1 [Araneus ventricosus]
MFQTRYLYFFSPPPELPYHTNSTRSNGRRWFPRWEVAPLYVFTSGRVSQQKGQREEDMWSAQLLMHGGGCSHDTLPSVRVLKALTETIRGASHGGMVFICSSDFAAALF